MIKDRAKVICIYKSGFKKLFVLINDVVNIMICLGDMLVPDEEHIAHLHLQIIQSQPSITLFLYPIIFLSIATIQPCLLLFNL